MVQLNPIGNKTEQNEEPRPEDLRNFMDAKRRNLLAMKLPSPVNNSGKDRLRRMMMKSQRESSRARMALIQQSRSSLNVFKTIRPHFGECTFFELEFQNPYPMQATFNLHIEDEAGVNEIYLVRGEELTFHRIRCDGDPDTRAVQFTSDTEFRMDINDRALFGFKFQSFAAGKCTVANEPPCFPFPDKATIPPISSPILPRTISITIVDMNKVVVSCCKVKVEPCDFTVDKTIRYEQSDQSIIEAEISLPAVNKIVGNASENILTCHCPDGSNFTLKNSVHGLQKLFFRYSIEVFPSVARFIIALYNDKYQSSLNSIWELVVVAQLRCHISGFVFLKQDRKLYLRHPAEPAPKRAMIHFAPTPHFHFTMKDPIVTMRQDAQNFASFQFQTTRAGETSVRVNLVDMDDGSLVQSYLLTLFCNLPKESRTPYTVELKAGEKRWKQFDYTNQTKESKEYNIVTSHPAIFVHNQSICIAPGNSEQIKVQVRAPKASGQHDVYLFIVAEKRLEEFIKFELTVIG